MLAVVLSILASTATAADVRVHLTLDGHPIGHAAWRAERSGPIGTLTLPSPLPVLAVSVLGIVGDVAYVEVRNATPGHPGFGRMDTANLEVGRATELHPQGPILGASDRHGPVLTLRLRVDGALDEPRAATGWELDRYLPPGAQGVHWLAGPSAAAWRTGWCAHGARLSVLPWGEAGVYVMVSAPTEPPPDGRLECRMIDDLGDWIDVIGWHLRATVDAG